MGLFEDAIAAESTLTPTRISVRLLSEATDGLNTAVDALDTAVADLEAAQVLDQPTVDNLVDKMAAVSAAAARLT